MASGCALSFFWFHLGCEKRDPWVLGLIPYTALPEVFKGKERVRKVLASNQPLIDITG